MAWNNIEPYVRATGAPVRVGVVKIKTGNARACVSIGRGLFNDLGKPGRCNVFAGDGDEAGQVMLQFDEDGVHEITRNQKGGGASPWSRWRGCRSSASSRRACASTRRMARAA